MAESPVSSESADPVSPRLQVPGTVDQIIKLTRYQLREYPSSRRFVALVGIVVVIAAIITFIVADLQSNAAVKALLASPDAFYGSFWGGGAGFVVVLSAVFFGGDAIAGEFQNKTGYFLMGLPIRRSAIYIGKYIAAFLASASMLLLYLVLLLLNGVHYFGASAFPWQFLPSLALALVYLMAVLGTTFLFSSLFKTSAYGFVLTAILFLIGFGLLQTLITSVVKIEPWMIISYANGAIGDVFAPTINWGLSGTVTVTKVPLGRGGGFDTVTSYTPGVAEGVVIMLAYFILTAIAGLYLFEREEFT